MTRLEWLQDIAAFTIAGAVMIGLALWGFQ
jgi:hypothetical protein